MYVAVLFHNWYLHIRYFSLLYFIVGTFEVIIFVMIYSHAVAPKSVSLSVLCTNFIFFIVRL